MGCTSEECSLNKPGLTALKRIKSHCLKCVPEQSIYGVRACTGEILNPEPHICPLHPFRLGTNPHLKGKRGKGNPEALKKWREHKESRPKLGAEFD